MREITFRALDKDKKVWVYFSLLEVLSGVIREVDIDKDTISQYTGLKDKNGKEIYEGDIVDGGNTIGEVVFQRGRFMPVYPDGCYDSWEANTMDSFEIQVIGNIYENPELIEEEN